MATIRDVALAAGVSVQTVSNVLHRKPFVRPETLERVQSAIDRLNYQPSAVAQSMRRQSSQALGFLVSDPNPRGLADPFYGEVLAGIVAAASAENWSLLIDILPRQESLRVEHFLRPFQTRRIDAAIVFLHGAAGQHVPVLAELALTEAPFALLAREEQGPAVYSVLAADFEGAHAATRTMIASGHRRIAFLGSAQRWSAVDARRQGYEQAMAEAGLAQWIDGCESSDWTAEGGAEATKRLLERSVNACPTALVAGNDVLAVGAMQALKAHDLRIPADMAIIGFDDFEFARYTDPPLTTVRLPAFEMGRRAAELLIAHLHGRPAHERRVVLPTELVIRQSAG